MERNMNCVSSFLVLSTLLLLTTNGQVFLREDGYNDQNGHSFKHSRGSSARGHGYGYGYGHGHGRNFHTHVMDGDWYDYAVEEWRNHAIKYEVEDDWYRHYDRAEVEEYNHRHYGDYLDVLFDRESDQEFYGYSRKEGGQHSRYRRDKGKSSHHDKVNRKSSDDDQSIMAMSYFDASLLPKDIQNDTITNTDNINSTIINSNTKLDDVNDDLDSKSSQPGLSTYITLTGPPDGDIGDHNSSLLSADSTPSTNMGVVIGIPVGIVILLLVLIIEFFVLRRYRKVRDGYTEQKDEPVQPVEENEAVTEQQQQGTDPLGDKGKEVENQAVDGKEQNTEIVVEQDDGDRKLDMKVEVEEEREVDGASN